MDPAEQLVTDTLQEITLPLDTILWLVFLIVLGFYVIFSAILYFHWDTYATDKKVVGATVAFYTLSTIPLLLIMLGIIFFI